MNVVVMDELSLKPMPGVSVDLFSGNTKLQSLPTNEYGQITFNQLSGKFILNIKTNNYAPYSQEIDLSRNYSDLSIKLIKSGHLKGHLTFSNQVNGGYLFLEPNYPNSIAIDSDGNFSVRDMKPGEYTLSFKENFKDGRNVLTKVPNKIIIESEKTLTLNLDIFKKED